MLDRTSVPSRAHGVRLLDWETATCCLGMLPAQHILLHQFNKLMKNRVNNPAHNSPKHGKYSKFLIKSDTEEKKRKPLNVSELTDANPLSDDLYTNMSSKKDVF